MLTIPFSHRYIKMPLGVDMPQAKTFLRGYRVVNRLSPRFIAYDTAIVGGGNFKLPAKGPYLILFLKTLLPLSLQFPGNIPYWTTVRCPWRRQARGCYTCGNYPGCRDFEEYDFLHHDGSHGTGIRPGEGANCWKPIIPAKYIVARGKEVKIVIEEKG